MNRLNDKVVIITGGNSGVGAAAAKLFAEEGAKVVISARRKEKLDEVAEEIRSNGGEVVAVSCDISNPEDARKLIEETLKAFGQIDVLVNNAGVLEEGLKPIDKATDEDINRIIDTNLKGTMYITREVAREMGANKSGSIVTVASVAGVNGGGGAAYASSKAGLVGLTKHTALRYAGKGVRANVICPGNILTPMTMNLNPAELDQDMLGAMAAHTDMQAGMCMPEDIANIALFLASDESRTMNGQVLVSDFGGSL